MNDNNDLTTTPLLHPPPHQNMQHSTAPSSRSQQLRRAIAATGAGAELSNEEINMVIQNLSTQAMGWTEAIGRGRETWSRYLVENYFSRWKWYNPNLSNPTAPPLSHGWAFFEYFTLPRRFLHDNGDNDNTKHHGVYIRAPPGEEASRTELYSWILTPLSAMSDWGIGVSMYFSTLMTMGCILALVGLVNIANIVYYSSGAYDPTRDEKKGNGGAGDFFDLLDILRFSAICTDREWVVCQEGCNEQVRYWNSIFANEYYGTAVDPTTGNEITLIHRTTCLPAQFQQGMWNLGTLILLIVCISAYMWYLSKLEIRYDEDNTSAPDYTVIVKNPPPTAYDPEEWRDFFERYSSKQVTLCTIALDNERLLRKLIQRRQDIKRLRSRLGTSIDFENADEVEKAVQDAITKRQDSEPSCLGKICGCITTPLLRLFGCGKTESEIWERLQTTTDEIKALQLEECKVSAVYITFETEQGQRTALEALNASRTELMTNTAINLDPSALFRGTVLKVEEASEPTAVRWMDLSYSTMSMNIRTFLTMCVTLGLVAASAVILNLCRTRVGTMLYAVILSTLNFIIPLVVRIMVSYEKHYDEGAMQRSLYIKITLFRWMNTAIITRLITPFVATLGVDKIDMINTINALIISEMLLSPLLRYLDIFEILNRHYFAPRATTHEDLYSCFTGGWYNLAERFTDFTKILLLAVFYSPFMPLIYFLCALILFIQYWMDKFLLLRSWQKAPLVGPETARFSRMYFTTAAVVLGAISSAYAYFHSPFTQLCDCTDDESCTLSQTTFTNVALLNGSTLNSVETSSNEAVRFCNQNIFSFPPVPAKQGSNVWMTESQERLSRIYGWFCLVLLVTYVVAILGQRIVKFVMACWKGVYKPAGVDQRKDFSSVIGVESFGYIPQLVVPGFHFPLLACNIDDIDVKLISWRNPNAKDTSHPHLDYDDYNLIFDVPYNGMKRQKNVESSTVRSSQQEGSRCIFSIVKQWPPEWAQNKQEEFQEEH
eukprot:CCRYP_005119-RB/>CCRYP_005119-RB protein AED:0.07 eAED:0.07 QI:209/1/1/1/0.77/0.7/10/1560/999